jgi:hypothetical protein
MAKVVIEFDTNEKTARATVDGVVMENVVCAEMHKKGYYGGYGPDEDEGDEPEFVFCLTTAEKDRGNKMQKMTRIVAAEQREAGLSTARAVAGLPSVKAVPAGRPGHAEAVRSIVGFFSQE